MSSFFADLAKTLGADLGQSLLQQTGQFISLVSPLFQAAFGVYVLMVIVQYYGQSMDVTFIDFVKRACGWLVIIGLAFSPALYMKLANIIYMLPDEVAASFTGSHKFSPSAMDASAAELKKLLVKISSVAKEYQWYEIAIQLKLSINIYAVVAVCGYLVIAVAFAFYMVAKISLALVLMMGAFFIGCLLFPSTRQYGINWIGQCLNYIVTTSMLVLVTMVMMQSFDAGIKMALQGTFLDIVALEAIPPLFLLQTVVFLIIIWNIPGIASALTGGAAVQGMARQLSSAVRGTGAAGQSVVRMVGSGISAMRGGGGGGGGGTISTNRRAS